MARTTRQKKQDAPAVPAAETKQDAPADVPAWKARRKRSYSFQIGDEKTMLSPNHYSATIGKVRKAKGKAPDGTTWTLVPRRSSTLYVDPVDLLYSDDPDAYQALAGDERAAARKKNRGRAAKAVKALA